MTAAPGGGTGTGEEDRVTIGVAIAVPQPFADELQGLRESFGDPLASAIPTHVTLLPPTAVPSAAMGAVRRHLAGVSAAGHPFDMRLRGSGTFRPVSPVVFVTLVQGISQCEQLAAAVRHGPLSVPLQFPYHPHVTVAHHLAEETLDRAFEELAGFECRFEAGGFHLYRHGDHDGWRPTRDFPLGGGG